MKKNIQLFIDNFNEKGSKSVICIVLFCFLGTFVHAQNFQKMGSDKNQTLIIGVGPSAFYGDTGGEYPFMKFPVKANFSVGYTKNLVNFLQLRFTSGYQRLVSWDGFNNALIQNWTSRGKPYAFQGGAVYFDIMPQFLLFPQDHVSNRPKFNAYGGIGLGAIFVNREQRVYHESGDKISRVNTLTSYIPLRGGLSYRIGYLYNIGLEGTFMHTFSDDLDGHTGYNFRNDHLVQLNLILMRYF